jgi:hypothetical protein
MVGAYLLHLPSMPSPSTQSAKPNARQCSLLRMAVLLSVFPNQLVRSLLDEVGIMGVPATRLELATSMPMMPRPNKSPKSVHFMKDLEPRAKDRPQPLHLGGMELTLTALPSRRPRKEPPRREQTPPRQTGPKRYHVVLQYTWNNKTLYDSKDVGATDEIDAERKVREHLAWSWKLTVGGKPPEFRHYKTTRI